MGKQDLGHVGRVPRVGRKQVEGQQRTCRRRPGTGLEDFGLTLGQTQIFSAFKKENGTVRLPLWASLLAAERGWEEGAAGGLSWNIASTASTPALRSLPESHSRAKSTPSRKRGLRGLPNPSSASLTVE